MSDYTPTTREVRAAFGAIFIESRREQAYAEFDTWLAEHGRQVAERAWDECIRSIEWAGRHGEGPLAYVYANSPYRAAKGEQK